MTNQHKRVFTVFVGHVIISNDGQMNSSTPITSHNYIHYYYLIYYYYYIHSIRFDWIRDKWINRSICFTSEKMCLSERNKTKEGRPATRKHFNKEQGRVSNGG